LSSGINIFSKKYDNLDNDGKSGRLFYKMEACRVAKGDNLIRLVKMVLLIDAHPGLSAKELARKNAVSERQIFRDIRALCYGGVPLYSDNGYRLLSKSGLEKVSLTLEEALALIYGLKLLEKQPVFLHSGNEARQKLLDLLPIQLRQEVQDIQKQLTVANEPTVDYSGKDDLFKKINSAIRNGQCVDMGYYSFSRDQFSQRKIDPYRIVFREGFWYLVAYCHLRSEIRLFRVDRIQELKSTAEYFDKPRDFDLEGYLGAAWQMERGREFTFTIRFKGEAARYVQETRFHPSQALTPDP
jgi:predicted DNA-binding transcriptional regulator YafY